MKENEIYYDAFISYRHTELDIYVAETLHKMLERYRIPKRIQESSGKTKITRIFRDRDELPTSSDLADNIQTALAHSEYLIVICSPEAVQSEWVQKEITTFLETHDKSKVLTILAKGEPAEAFPEILCYNEKKVLTENGEERIVHEMVEPLAADVRGKDKQEVHKKLKNEVLRILAPLLSCSYDDLRQRHREYQMRRTLIAAGACTCLALLFTVYALYQKEQIQTQYEQALINESQYLVERSAQLLAEGDREGALETALEAAPSEEEDRPLIPEVVYALNNALYSYQNEGRIMFCADKMLKTDSRMLAEGEFSLDGKYYLELDESGIAYFYDGTSGEELWKFRPSDIEGIEDPMFVYKCFVSPEKAVLVTANYLMMVNPGTQSVENLIRTDLGADSFDTIVCNESYVFIDNSFSCMSVFDLESGDCIYEGKYYDLELSDMGISCGQWMDKEEPTIVLGLCRPWSGSELTGILLLTAETGEMQLISGDEVAEICKVDENTVATLEYIKEDYYADERWCYVRFYDLQSGQRIWSSGSIYTYNSVLESSLNVFDLDAYVDGESKKVLAASVDETLLMIETESRDEFVRVHYSDKVVGIGQYDTDRLIVGLADGTIWIQTRDNSVFRQNSGEIDNEVTHFSYDKTCQTAIQVISDSNKAVLGRMQDDESMTMVEMNGEAVTFGYMHFIEPEKNYRVIMASQETDDDKKNRELLIQDVDTDETILRKEIGYVYMESMESFDSGGKHYFNYVVSAIESNDLELHTVDLETGEEIFVTMTADEDCVLSNQDNIACAPEDDWAVHYYASSFGVIRLTDGEVLLPYEKHLGDGYISEVWPLSDGRHLVFVFKNYTDNTQSILLWDMEERAVSTELLADQVLDDIVASNHISICKEKNVMAVYLNQEVWIVDLFSGEVSQKIPFYGDSFCKFGFINEGKYLLMYGDSRELIMWDLEAGQIAMKSEEYFEGGIDIIPDSNGEYFGIKEIVQISDYGIPGQPLHIFSVDDENGAFYHYADVVKGFAIFEAEEICCVDWNGKYYYTKMKSIEELREDAEEILGH